MSLFINMAHNEDLDENVIEEVYELQNVFSDVEENLREFGTHFLIVRYLYVTSRLRSDIGLVCCTIHLCHTEG